MPVNITNVQLSGGAVTPVDGSIRGEFPKDPNTNPTSLSQFYRGGANVLSVQGDAGYGLIPVSGQISFGPFRNQTRAWPTTGNTYIALGEQLEPGPYVVGAGIRFMPNGNVQLEAQGAVYETSTGLNGWFNPSIVGIGSNYWVRYSSLSSPSFGTLNNGASDWSQLNLERLISLNYESPFSSISDEVTGIAQITASDPSFGPPVVLASHQIILRIATGDPFGSPPPPPPAGSTTNGNSYSGFSSASSIASTSISVNTNGTITCDGTFSGENGWYNPTTAGIGNSHWVRATLTSSSGGGVVGGNLAFDTWTQIDANRSISLTLESPDFNSSSISISFSISTSPSGTPVVGTFTATLTSTTTGPGGD